MKLRCSRAVTVEAIDDALIDRVAGSAGASIVVGSAAGRVAADPAAGCAVESCPALDARLMNQFAIALVSAGSALSL